VFPSLRVFDREFRDVRLSYKTEVLDRSWNMRLAGTVGVDVFDDQRFTLDATGGRAWLERLEVESVAQTVQRLLRQYPDRTGRTPLMAAAYAGRADVVKALVEQGQDVNAHSTVDETAVYFASTDGDAESVKLLLQHKAVPDVAIAVGGASAVHLAAERGNEAVLRALLEAGAKADVPDLRGRTPLFCATEAGSLECVRVLLAAKANPNYTGKIKYSPLLVAAEKGWLEIVKAMLDAGADMNKPAPVLPVAAGSDNVELVRLLLDRGADINATLPDGGTALMSAAFNGQTETVRLLLQRGADTTLRSKAGKTALTYVAENAGGIGPCVRLLIDATPTTQPAK
jgi:ankyrin repeat protein